LCQIVTSCRPSPMTTREKMSHSVLCQNDKASENLSHADRHISLS
jgi:hypothetical protein